MMEVSGLSSLLLIGYHLKLSKCGHCQHLKPEFEKLAPKLDELGVKVGMVNGETNRKLVGEYVVDQ